MQSHLLRFLSSYPLIPVHSLFQMPAVYHVHPRSNVHILCEVPAALPSPEVHTGEYCGCERLRQRVVRTDEVRNRSSLHYP